jgi:hypothetical protein
VLDALASFQAQLNRSHSKHGDHQHG